MKSNLINLYIELENAKNKYEFSPINSLEKCVALINIIKIKRKIEEESK